MGERNGKLPLKEGHQALVLHFPEGFEAELLRLPEKTVERLSAA
ncbi:hypothetical protein [Brevibacillus borstelensis]